MTNEPQYVVVIGASAGGFNALFELVRYLKPETNAAYLIVLHLSARSVGSYLAHRLQEYTRLRCLLAANDLPIRKGYIYVGVPNHHLLLTKDGVKLGNGPAENRWRPSIDVLFKSAAAHFGNRAIGIILTGLLNDGTIGMDSIKRAGGTAIVQDPNESEYPDMPLSVLKTIHVDYVLPLAEIGPVIDEVAAKPPEPQPEIPADIRADAQVFERIITTIKTQEEHGRYTPFTCPDCGGVLFEQEHEKLTKLKCHTGHSYTVRDLILKQSEEFESSIWFAIRSMEQKKVLLQSIADKYRKSGTNLFAQDYEKRIREIDSHITNLKSILFANLDEPDPE